MSLIASSFIESSFIVPPALAVSPQQELERTHSAIEQAKETQGELAREAARIEAERAALQARLVEAARKIQRAETELTDAEEKLRILDQQRRAAGEKLSAQKAHLATLVRAAISLSHTPPEAMLMMPGDPVRMMQTGRALGMTSKSIREEAESLALQMAELEKLTDKVKARRDEVAAAQAALDEERRGLTAALSERAASRRALGRRQKEETEKLARLAKRAKDLQALIASLAAEPEPFVEKTPGGLRSFAAARGRLRPPAAGRIVQRFGARERHGVSKGITFQPRAGAPVIAPYDGEVAFTGPFLNYGRMVIIRHSDGFHTLLAGLSEINVTAGQFLLEGEPIGAMGGAEVGKNKNRLYMELRQHHKPVDPRPWIGGL